MFSSLPFGFMFIFVTLFGTIFSISSSHWLGVWVGLEINLIGFLPVLVYQKSTSESESAVKYFVVQALGSGLLIFGSLTNCSLSYTWEMMMDSSIPGFIIILSGLIIKMGMFPFHFWLPSVMAGLPWVSCLLLATWQKIAPLFLISSFLEAGILYSFIILLSLMASGSSIIGGIGGMNQTQVRAILAYSSIGHLGWIVFASCQGVWAMKSYFSIYLVISVSVFMALWYLNLNNIKNLTDLMTPDPWKTFSIMVMLLSLGGLPPLLGFISKWVVVSSSMNSNFWIFLFFLILGSVLSLFYYLSLYFSIFLGSSKSMYMNMKTYPKMMLFLTTALLLNLSGGLVLIFLNLLKEF
uniref:NADH-ubiquinone oxidoreductase chain 2 n=1 Tax=Littorina brevicula TaxID=45748 RepID=A0A7L7YVG7_9CAEN|nr:NADH dehydrogenase subunit 2 [Littorina brevicula]QOD40610.1 NADH dehydrogenase subunit 2 [Littorina brevicula]ULR86934.1 NADH dehydrogenase subunit 2 [Littorina brevicula]UOH96723.1 NADH dehydrogenase subunit 2 [Littorina brevicula]